METANGRLWTKDFSIITFGTVVSMLGNAVSGFAIGLLVLDYTDSVFLYAFFMVCYNLPRIVLPIFAGPYLDRFSRSRVIYTLDFISAGLYALIFLLLLSGFFNYWIFIAVAMVIGGIDSVYNVAYESLYPTLISKGNFTKAYSVSSLIYPLANTIMVPVAGLCYQSVGLPPLFLFNAATFLVAAIAETRISSDERHVAARADERLDRARFIRDLRSGFAYLRQEKGLSAITWYFFVSTLTYSVCMTLELPYFRSTPGLGVMAYVFVMGASTVGRLVGGVIHYRFRYPTGRKFVIAVFVYLILCVFQSVYLYLPYAAMLVILFFSGLFGVTSYNIRTSSTQNYVPDAMRGRFNGLFVMLNMLGGIVGQLIAGTLGEFLPTRPIFVGAMVFNALGVFALMLPRREAVKRIYNVDV
ncbi:MAG: MFS transporter [Clostridia bacterium]|nr:MFS transporter [Clostridia bacterium]